MRPIIITFPAGPNGNAVAATQTITATAGAGVILNGSAAPVGNLTPSATTASSIGPTNQSVVFPGIARPATIFATFTATGVVFTIVGRDLRGNTITATIIGASGGTASTATDVNNVATTNGTDFNVITGVITSASFGPFSVGYGATGETQWCQMDVFKNPFNMTVGGELTATTTTYTIQDTPDNVQTVTNPVTFNHTTIANIATTSLESNYAYPARFVRGVVSTNSATGGVTFFFTQAG